MFGTKCCTSFASLLKRLLDLGQLAANRRFIVGELRLLIEKSCASRCEILEFTLGTLSIECVSVRELAYLSRCPVGVLNSSACRRQRSTN
jgi:hypothetical protein